MAARRFAVGVAYHGPGFSGFAANRQARLPSVQDQLTAALAQLAPHSNFQASSRTDAGVHALRNVFSFDIHNPQLSEDNILQGLNFHLPSPTRDLIRVTDVRAVAADFCARTHATSRTYVYRIVSCPPAHALMHRAHAWVLGEREQRLDVEAMRACAHALFLGERDFASFQSSGCQSHSTHRNVSQLDVAEVPVGVSAGTGMGDPLFDRSRLVTLTITANAFLLRQVRNMTAALVMLGQGRLSQREMAWVVEARDRATVVARLKIRPAPACGLFLQNVGYDGARLGWAGTGAQGQGQGQGQGKGS